MITVRHTSDTVFTESSPGTFINSSDSGSHGRPRPRRASVSIASILSALPLLVVAGPSERVSVIQMLILIPHQFDRSSLKGRGSKEGKTTYFAKALARDFLQLTFWLPTKLSTVTAMARSMSCEVQYSDKRILQNASLMRMIASRWRT